MRCNNSDLAWPISNQHFFCRPCAELNCFVLEITSNDDVCGPVEYPCSTNHVEINDVYVCIHNGWGELRKSALSELSLTNKNKHEYYGASQPHSLTVIMTQPSLYGSVMLFISISQSTNERERNHIDINDKYLLFTSID